MKPTVQLMGENLIQDYKLISAFKNRMKRLMVRLFPRSSTEQHKSKGVRYNTEEKDEYGSRV